MAMKITMTRLGEGLPVDMDVNDPQLLWVTFEGKLQVSVTNDGAFLIRSNDGALSIRPQAANTVQIQVTDF
jgi:hypothetical protein